MGIEISTIDYIKLASENIIAEVKKLECRIKELEEENIIYRKRLGIDRGNGSCETIASTKIDIIIKDKYKELSSKNHIICEHWLVEPIEAEILSELGYVQYYPQRIISSGTFKAWIHESILEGHLIYQQSVDHFNTVIQIAATLIDYGFENIIINHWNDVDVSASYNGVTYAFEYERPGSHSLAEIRDKFGRAKLKYDFVFIICSHKNKNDIIRAVEPTFDVQKTPRNFRIRGVGLKTLIEEIVEGKIKENIKISEELEELL